MVQLAPGRMPAVGDKLTLFSTHVCITVNLSDELVVQAGVVQQVWVWSIAAVRQVQPPMKMLIEQCTIAQRYIPVIF